MRGSKAALLQRRHAHIDARSIPFARGVERALRRYLARRLPKMLAHARGHFAKVDPDTQELENELARLIEQYGVRGMVSAANEAAGERFSPGSLIADYLASKHIAITGMAEETRKQLEAILQDVLREAHDEYPTPSPGTIAHRIEGVLADSNAVSYERAVLIARTELVQAENTGIFAGYQQSGVQFIEWLAYQGPYPSGAKRGKEDRHHDHMHGLIVAIGDRFYNPATGNYLRYPGDPDCDIQDTANCRCNLAPATSATRQEAA